MADESEKGLPFVADGGLESFSTNKPESQVPVRELPPDLSGGIENFTHDSPNRPRMSNSMGDETARASKASAVKLFIDDALAFAFDQFNLSEYDRDDMHEYGSLLWTDLDGHFLIPQALFKEPTTDGNIKLYSEGGGFNEMVNAGVLEGDCTLTWKAKQYIGDYHTHPRYHDWIRQMPSPEDATILSIVADLWELTKPQQGCDQLRLSPVIQIVQTSLFGDVFLLEAAQRTTFETVEEQQQFCDRAFVDYRLWYDTKREEWGDLPAVVLRADFRKKAKEAEAKLAEVLQRRAVVRFVENVANPDQEVDMGY